MICEFKSIERKVALHLSYLLVLVMIVRVIYVRAVIK